MPRRRTRGPFTDDARLAPVTRYAVITGASSGIGRAVAIQLASRGWGTFLVARRTPILEELAASLRPTAPSIAVTADLSDAAQIQDAVGEVLRHPVQVSLLINNAGFGHYRTCLSHGLSEHRRLMDVNYFAPLQLITSFLPHMLQNRGGHIINILSMSAKMAPWGHSGYAASKAALRALGESLEAEYSPRGVRVSGVFPGLVDTPYFDGHEKASLRRRMQPRMISAEACARTICRVVDRPRLSTCTPRHYRLLDLIAAFSPSAAHALVTRHSREPARTPNPFPIGTPGPSSVIRAPSKQTRTNSPPRPPAHGALTPRVPMNRVPGAEPSTSNPATAGPRASSRAAGPE